jgi:ribosomal protein L35
MDNSPYRKHNACSNSNRRKRQLREKQALPSTSTNAYRLHYCCEHLGKYVGSTKRRITW